MNTALTLQIGGDISRLHNDLNKASGLMDRFENQISAIGTNLTGFFAGAGLAAIGNFAFQVANLSAEADGVSHAFNKLPHSVRLLDELKRATHDTVSEMDLMKRAVQFDNFGLNLEKLPTMLKFATVQAQQTGQSVEYLVDSIVTGLGRKSVLIMDNLGISSQQLNAEIEKTGDFVTAAANIIDQRLGKMGDMIENTKTKTEQFGASWKNLQVWLGGAADGAGVLGKSMQYLIDLMDVTSSSNVNGWLKYLNALTGGLLSTHLKQMDTVESAKKLREETKKQEQVIREVDRAYVEFNKDIDAYGKTITTHILKTQLLNEFQRRLNDEEKKKQASIENIANLTEKLNGLQELQLIQTGESLANTNREISSIEAKIKALKELGKTQERIKPSSLGKPLEFDYSNLDRFAKSLNNVNVNVYKLVAGVKLLKPAGKDIKAGSQEWTEAWGKVGVAAMNFNTIFNESIANAAVGFADAMGQMAAGVGGAELIASSLLGAFGNMASQLGQLAIATGIAVLGIKEALLKMNPFAAIAAGVALVALGSFVSAKARAIGSGGGRGGSGGGSSNFGSSGGGRGTRGQNLGERVQVVEFKIKGSDLVSTMESQGRKNGRVKFG
jgi:hypothetical protein